MLICNISELFCYEFFEIFVILSAVLLPIKPPVASAVFRIALFEAVSNASAAECLALRYYLYSYQYFSPYFQKKIKIHSFLQIFNL